MTEEWRPIEGYDGDYDVSNLGRVWSWKAGRLLKLSQDRKGYFYVNLWRVNKQKRLAVHRLVAFSFLPPTSDTSLFVCHIDGNPKNNVPSNLYWGTRSENEVDKVRHGTSNRGEAHPLARLTGESVDAIRLARMRGETLQSIADSHGLDMSYVGYICRGEAWAHRPFPAPSE